MDKQRNIYIYIKNSCLKQTSHAAWSFGSLLKYILKILNVLKSSTILIFKKFLCYSIHTHTYYFILFHKLTLFVWCKILLLKRVSTEKIALYSKVTKSKHKIPSSATHKCNKVVGNKLLRVRLNKQYRQTL